MIFHAMNELNVQSVHEVIKDIVPRRHRPTGDNGRVDSVHHSSRFRHGFTRTDTDSHVDH